MKLFKANVVKNSFYGVGNVENVCFVNIFSSIRLGSGLFLKKQLKKEKHNKKRELDYEFKNKGRY